MYKEQLLNIGNNKNDHHMSNFGLLYFIFIRKLNYFDSPTD